ncbi:hypothetical protein ACHHYP_06641 [Achlya hypogyna]|uniref:PX domain-containing protein n=1 Tax=Achlya hypogyna TaxID=1202772 RepID=A0A1V9YT35_ACHHY|nr:hypothetical protein ACHHYP_06641 [Achlya hypogyna]
MPKSKSAFSAAVSEYSEPQGRSYVISGQSINEQGVVLYHIDAQGTTVKKRFNEFKVFHQQLSGVTAVPALPEAGLFTAFQRKNDALIVARAARFQEIIDVAAESAVAHLEAFVGITATISAPPASTHTIIEEVEVAIESTIAEPVAEEAVDQSEVVTDDVAQAEAPACEEAISEPKSVIVEEKTVVVI